MVCGNEYPWHVTSGARHPYTPDGVEWDMGVTDNPTRAAADDSGPTVRMVAGPLDAVLRMALVDKGILTPDDLQAAEKKLNTWTAVLGVRTGDGS